jgi:hypothetical protein
MPTPPRNRRPRSVLLVAALVVAVALLDLARALQAVTQRAFLAELPLPIPPALWALVHGGWALVLMACALGLWRLRPWARRATALAAPLHELTFIAMLAAFGRAEPVQSGWPVALLLSSVTILAIWVLLSLRSTKRAFTTYPAQTTRDEP